MADTVLFGTDFSELSGKAFDEAIRLAKRLGADLVVAHVLQFPPMLSELPAQTEETENAMRRWCTHRLDELAARANSSGVKARGVLREGVHAYTGVTELAGETKATMVVLGTHGRTGLSRLVMGSVAARVIAEAPCPVLTVRAA